MLLRVIVDSNFLFVPIQFQVDIIDELDRVMDGKIEAILLSPVYEELKSISEMGGIKGRQAATALRIAERLERVNVEIGPFETVDDLIVRLAAEWRCYVATNDKTLRKRLKDINISIIFLRKRSHLEIN